jgi:predicted CoA-binding protein
MTIDGLSDDEVLAILKRVRAFAVVGASNKPHRPSNDVMRFLLEQGYLVEPVNPTIADEVIFGRKVHADLAAVPPPVDVIDIFRTSDAVPEIVQDAIKLREKLGASVIWMQLGIVNEAAAAAARAHGFTVVMDRCPKIEFSRLLRG